MTRLKGQKYRTYIDVKFRSIFVASTFSMLIEYLMSLSDKIIAGNLIGAEALSAITLVEPFTLLIAFIACVLADITGAPVTEATGKGDIKRAEQYFSQSLLIAIVIGLFLTILYVAFTEQLIEMVAGTSGQAAYVSDYFSILRFLPLPMLLNAVIYPIVLYRGGEQYCNISACFSIISNIGLSVILCHFIGMKGMGLGTVIGSCLGLFPLILFLVSPKGKMKLSFYFSIRDIRDNLIYSLGGSLTYFYMAIFQIIMNMFIMERFSEDGIIIFTGVINVAGLMAALTDGIIEFLMPMLNSYRGEKNELGCKCVVEKSLKASIAESIILTLILCLFARVFARVFGVEDVRLAAKFANALRIYAASSVCYYVINLYAKYYLYTGKAAFCLGIDCLKDLVFPGVCGISFGMMFGLNGIWFGLSIAQVILLVGGYFLIRRKNNAGKDLLFLNTDKMAEQYMWNIRMNQEQIMQLVEEIRETLKKEGISTKQINKAALVVEESQMRDLGLNKENNKVIIECSMLKGEDITLILRNTGICNNILDEDNPDSLSAKIVSKMAGISNSYILVNGNNRLIFHIAREEN